MLDSALCLITATYRVLYLTGQYSRAVTIFMLVITLIGDKQCICILMLPANFIYADICNMQTTASIGVLANPKNRWCMLPTIYTILEASRQDGGSIMEPVVHSVIVTVTHEKRRCLRSFNYCWASYNA